MLEINYEIIKISKILITESLLSRCSLLSLSLFLPSRCCLDTMLSTEI